MTVRGIFNLVEIMLNVGGMFLGGQKNFFGTVYQRSVQLILKRFLFMSNYD